MNVSPAPSNLPKAGSELGQVRKFRVGSQSRKPFAMSPTQGSLVLTRLGATSNLGPEEAEPETGAPSALGSCCPTLA